MPPAVAAPTSSPDALLVRAIGVRQLSATIFNYTIGSGIFALPAIAAAQLGSAAPLAYLTCAAIMLLVVVSFAEAGSRVSVSGGPYAYIEAAFGPFTGLLSGVLMVVSSLSGVAVVITLFAGSVLALADVPSTSLNQGAIAIAVVSAVTFFNVRGVHTGVRVVEIVTAAKLIPLLLFVAIGVAFVDPANLVWSDTPDTTAILATSGVVIFAFMGIESAVGPSGEIRDPWHTVPRASLIALVGVCVLYLAVQAVAQGILGSALGASRITPLAAAADAAVGDVGRTVMLVGAAVSMLGFLFGAGLVNPRIVFALARDGFLPRSIAGVHGVYRTPHVAILSCALVVLVLALTGTFERLLIISNIAALLVYLMLGLAALNLRRRGVRAGGEPFRFPGATLVHLLGFAAITGMLTVIVTRQDVIGVAILVSVTVIAYLLRSRPRRS
jgi:APA family basic amino acid/polyamine antiporter